MKLQTEKLFLLIEKLKDEDRITFKEENDIKMALAQCQEYSQAPPFLLLEGNERLRLGPGVRGFLTEARIVEVSLVDHLIEEGVSRSAIEYFLQVAYSEYAAEVQDLSSLSFTETLRIAIIKKLPTLAHYLLDNNLCMKEQEPSVNRSTCLQLILFAANYDEALFLKIVAREVHVNHALNNGLTALYIAADGNEFALKHLLNRPDICVAGRNLTKRVIELNETNPRVMAILKEKVQHESYVLAAETNCLGFPVAWLSEQNRERLLQNVKRMMTELPIFRADKELTNAFDEFLHDTTPLQFKHTDRLSIAADCLSYIIAPKTINQHCTALCGVACVMQHLVIADPAKFIYSVIDLCELHRKKPRVLPARVRNIPYCVTDFAYQLSNVWLETVRHNYNGFFPYDSTSRFEAFMAVTSPFQLELMYRDFGFGVMGETLQVRFDSSNRVGRFFNTAREAISHYGSLPTPFKIYGSQHREVHDDDARFNDLCVVSEKSKYLTVLIKFELLNMIMNIGVGFNLLHLIEVTHYITIDNFRYNNETGRVSFNFMTFGAVYSANLALDDFKSHYLGAMAVDYDQPLLLQNNEELDGSRSDAMGGPH